MAVSAIYAISITLLGGYKAFLKMYLDGKVLGTLHLNPTFGVYPGKSSW